MAQDAQFESADHKQTAATKLEALARKHQQEQTLFCREFAAAEASPGGTPHNDTYTRLPAVRAVGNPDVTYPMWVHKQNDIVSNELIGRGVWEPAETANILARMEEWKQVRQLVCFKGNCAVSQVVSTYACCPAVLLCDLLQADVVSQANAQESGGTVLLDVGANVGWFTLQAAAIGYRVLAVEPMPRNQGALRRTLCENPKLAEKVTLIPKVRSTRCSLPPAANEFFCCTWGPPVLLCSPLWPSCPPAASPLASSTAALVQGLSDKPRKCQLYVLKSNKGNGTPVCEGAAFAK